MTVKQIIEALIFASQKPITSKEIITALKGAGDDTEDETRRAYAKLKEADVLPILQELHDEYQQGERAFQLIEQVQGWHFVTHPETAPWVKQLYPECKPTRLSAPALETLAIISYRQPITRGDIEAIRGVAVDGVMNSLLERGLVKIAGRAEVPGRPLLYQTTNYFLEHFGLKTLDELPNNNELRKMDLPKAPVKEDAKKEDSAPASEATEQTTEAPAEETPAEENNTVEEPVENAEAAPEENSPAETSEQPVENNGDETPKQE